MFSRVSSSNCSARKKNNLVKKLTQQIETIDAQVTVFNSTERSRVESQGMKRKFLKTMTEPKLHKAFEHKLVNPEHEKIEQNTKISKFFKNTSTLSKFDFTGNDFFLRASSRSIGWNNNERVHTKTEEGSTGMGATGFELLERKGRVELEWDRIDRFRRKNGIDTQTTLPMPKRVKTILQRL